LSSVSKVWQPDRLAGKTRGITAQGEANWCYRRVLNQSMMHAPVFFYFLGTHAAGQGQCTGWRNCVACLYRNFSRLFWRDSGSVAEDKRLCAQGWKNLNRRLNTVGRSTIPAWPPMGSASGSINGPVDHERQEDTGEFLIFVLNALAQHGSTG